MRIKIDIDNVIRDMSGQMVTVYNYVYKNKLKRKFTKNDIKDYDIYQNKMINEYSKEIPIFQNLGVLFRLLPYYLTKQKKKSQKLILII